MLRIRLPYPDHALNPNTRRVWQASLKPKREAREVGYYSAMEAVRLCYLTPERYWSNMSLWWLKPDEPLRLRIAIHPPDNRRRDLDNTVSAIKNYQDGIFSYIGMDDSKITYKEVIMRRSCPEGKIVYILYQK